MSIQELAELMQEGFKEINKRFHALDHKLTNKLDWSHLRSSSLHNKIEFLNAEMYYLHEESNSKHASLAKKLEYIISLLEKSSRH